MFLPAFSAHRKIQRWLTGFDAYYYELKSWFWKSDLASERARDLPQSERANEFWVAARSTVWESIGDTSGDIAVSFLLCLQSFVLSFQLFC